MKRSRWRSTAPAITLALAAGALAPGADALAATYYVDVASRGGPCSDARTPTQNTIRTPWCTLRRAVIAAPAGSSVAVRAGSYPRLEVSDVAKSSYVTFAPYGTEVPAIAGATLARVSFLRFTALKTTSSVTMSDSHHVEFVGGESALKPAGTRTPTAFALTRVQDILIADRYIHDGFSAVVIPNAVPGSRRIVVRGNLIRRMGNDGVYVGENATDVQIVDNDLIDVRPRSDMDSRAHSDGVQAIGPTENLLISGNYVRGGRGFLLQVSPPNQDRVCCGHVNTRIVNNMLTGYSFAIRTWSLVGARIVNNTVWGSTTGTTTGVNINDRVGTANHRTTKLVLANNIMKQFTLGTGVHFAVRDFNLIKSGPLGGPRDVAGSPVFEDWAAGDLELVRGSRGVDAASSNLAPATDADGLGRAGAPDTGALELHP